MNRWCTSPFWDKNITNAPYPYLTECFRNTVLQWIPIGFFWFILPLWFYAHSKSKFKSSVLPVSRLFIMKIILTILFLFGELICICHYLFFQLENQGYANLFTPIVYSLTTSLIIWLLNHDRLKGVYSSGLLFLFWLFVTVAGIPDIIDRSIQFSQRTYRHSNSSQWIELFNVWIHFLSAFGLLISNFFAEKFIPTEITMDNRPIMPENSVSFPSRVFYSWVTPLILQGYKKPLTEKDCWELSKTEKTDTVVQQVRQYMKPMTNNINTIGEDEHQSLLNGLPKIDVKKTPHRTPVFWHALFRTYSDKLIVGGLLRFLHDIFQFTGPLLLKRVLNFFNDRNQPQWIGIFWAILLSITVFLQIILLRAYFQCQFLVGIRFRAAVTGLVYRKSLKLSNSARQGTTTGEIINLMAIDASRFGEITTQMHICWSGPLQLLIALVLLYRQMQLSIIPGVVLLFVMIPINLFLQRIQKILTTKQMIVKDQRIRMMNELLNGIRVLKLYAWENAFITSITEIRDKELRYIRTKAIISAASNILWTFTPILVAIATFATHVLSSKDNILTPEKAFVSLSLFNLLRTPLNQFPNVINSVVEAFVSNKRIQKFLSSEEIDENAVERVPLSDDGYSIKIEDASFRWSNQSEDPIILKNINFRINQGSLVALVGMVGSGKTSILSALLGEMNKIEGRVCVSGKIAYVPQTAWIMNTTLKENILFGQDFNKYFYDRVIEACALKQDFDMLPAGDQTEIGEKGINLSGGQRQRVSLARALYSNADIYLLDDPLSAVDAHVGVHIFKRVIGPQGLLSSKTRLLVTHGVSHLNRCDDILVISQGEIVDHGSYPDLIIRSNILKDFVKSVISGDAEQSSRRTSSDFDTPRSVPETPLERIANPFDFNTNDVEQEEAEPTPIEIEDEKKKIIQKENIQTGSVQFNIFKIYMRACKLISVVVVLGLFCLTVSASLSANIWLSKWTDSGKRNETSSKNQIHNMNIYSMLGFAQGILSFLMQLTQKLAAFTAARKLHLIILLGVLHAPMSFFDTTPIGRIINRFAKDIDSVDTTLPNAFSQTFTALITVVSTLIILVYGSWLAIIEFIPLAILFAYIQRVYVSSSRQLRRLDSVSRSWIFANFSETIQGLSSIRAYHAQKRFINISDKFIDRNQSCHLASSVSNRWLGVRLEMICNLLTLFTAVTAVFMRDHLTAGTVGLMITCALQITHFLNVLVRNSSEIEANIVSVERINEYAELEPEAPWKVPDTEPPENWPTIGRIQIKDLSTKYRDNLQLVLKDLTLDIEPGEKIGIIGRTGSGKSSLCLALFRMIEPTQGTILIDDVDIRLIGLHDLRSKITIIPQDTIIFAGTIRFNVDPFNHYSDEEIWSALELVHLKERIKTLDHGLVYMLAEGGQNLSAGERQLLCLARALLRKSKIIILDEATAAIDMETDRLIQLTIRSAFKNATVLTIAHRLHTILDSSKILVLSNGSVLEYDTTKSLADDNQSAFYKLLRAANIRPSDIPS